MHKKDSINKVITGIGLFLVTVIAYAGAPLWTFTPLTATTVSVAVNDTTTIKYQITNQSKKTHTLVEIPIPGVRQVPGSGNCPNPFTLKYNESCILNLQVTGSALSGKVFGGPKICSQGNLLQCYQPNQANSLNITVLMGAAVTPSSLSVNVGQMATFTANQSGGTAPYSYQWYSCATIACSSPTVIGGAISRTYSPTTATAGTHYYQARVTDAAKTPETATTNVATLTIDNAFSATVTPSTLSVDAGQTASFTVNSVGGTPPYSYQWYSCTTSACSAPTVIGGATSSTLSPSTITPGTYYYQAVATDSTATPETATTNSATLTVDNAFSAALTPSSLAVGVGQTATFTATPTGGTPPYSYQWYSCTTLACSAPTLISGATSSTYNPYPVIGTYYYQAIVTDSTTTPNTVTTSGATLTVASQYSYVSDGTANLWQCPMTTTGAINGGACTALTNSTSPGFYQTQVTAFATFSGATYVYVVDYTANLWKCPMTATGSISGGACTQLTNATSPGFSAAQALAFATFSTTNYVYISDGSANLWQCPMNATGDFSAGCTQLTNSTAPGFDGTASVTFATFSGTTYAYVPDFTTKLWQCPMNATGGFSGGCTALTNSTAPGFDQANSVVFATFSGTTYAYVGVGTTALWKCPMNTTTGAFSGGCTLESNITSPGFSSTFSPTFNIFSGATYAYAPDSSANLWQCPMTASGDISGTACTELTNGTSPGFSFTVSATFATF